jgi:hypothetical protein
MVDKIINFFKWNKGTPIVPSLLKTRENVIQEKLWANAFCKKMILQPYNRLEQLKGDDFNLVYIDDKKWI